MSPALPVPDVGSDVLTAIMWLASLVATVLIATRGQRKEMKQISKDARTAAEQTANEHSDTEFPNLRDELSAMHQTVRDVAGQMTEVKAEQRATRSDIGGMREESRQDRRRVDGIAEEIRGDRRRVDEHIADCIADWRTGQPPPT